MAVTPTITFSRMGAPAKGTAIVLATDGVVLSDAAKKCDPAGNLPRAVEAADFRAKFGTSIELLAPAGSQLQRLIVLGCGVVADLDAYAWMRLGGAAAALIRSARDVGVVLDISGSPVAPEYAAAFAAGMLLRSYGFDKYKTRIEADAAVDKKPARVNFLCASPTAARKAFADVSAVTEGVLLARDLVNEPANTMGPVEMVDAARSIGKLGAKIDVLTEKEMKKLGMGALLGVAQGSSRPARVVVVQWNGGRPKDKPVAFVGKGVVFDTGGNSMKSPAGMEDMKGDMGGAAAVIGLMHALAARKAKANVVGVVGIVENMVDGNAQRPGDIVRSMSGQTIEVMNTDAEGRLVLADVLWYTDQRFEPRLMVDLATLTGAVMVALGQHHAGLFSNNEALAAELLAAGEVTQERLWRLPMGPEFDKLIDSKNADMKNVGGRFGGAIIAAQFLRRFVKNTPWAHLDIAGVAMSAPGSEINQSWASGFGVRLLDRFVRDNYES